MILDPNVENQIRLLISQNRKLEAVKLVHDVTRCGLKQAKDYVDNFGLNSSPVEFNDMHPANDNTSFNSASAAGDMDVQLLSLLAQGQKLAAVKLHKDFTGASLADSKAYVDNLEEEKQRPTVNFEPKFITEAGFNKRDTPIDSIMNQQPQSKVLISTTQGTSPLRVLLLVLALIVIVGVLMYLFVGR